MSLHKLTAGSGYDYLTRQVAALDATEKGHTGLASYYTERGESPGVWIGSGLDGIDGLAAGDPVTAEQMRALFGCGLHPLAELRQQQLEGPELTLRDFQNATRLAVPFKIVDNDLIPFRLEVAKRIAALNTTIGSPADASIAAADQARVRTEVAREFFLTEHGRAPVPANSALCRGLKPEEWTHTWETDATACATRGLVSPGPALAAEWSSCGRGDVRFQDAQLVSGNARMCQSLTL